MPLALALPQSVHNDLRKLLAFGAGVGIAIDAQSLEVVAARVRPSKITVLGRLSIAHFADRPAAEWGAEYARFLKSLGVGHLAATVLLPRREVIVRHLALPGVSGKDLEGAIRFQLDNLHPYGEEEIEWGWSPLAFGAVLIGVVRREVVDRYHRLFTEAGIAVASFTFSAAAVHAAIRLNGHGQASNFVALGRSGSGAVEVYGESQARPVFSAEFALPPARAASLALAELRLPPETEPVPLEEILPKPAVNPVENDLSRNALPYATALAGACPRLAPSANVLPADRRRANSRAALIPTLILAGVALLAAAAVLVWQSYAQRRYLAELNAEIAKIEPQARRAEALDREIAKARARAALLDRFRSQTKDDLDALNELTRIIAPPTWTNAIDLSRDMVRITGNAPQASPLVKILDSSPLFGNSAPEFIVRAPNGSGENFQIHSVRKAAK
jgi:type II secretory pathway component PulL